MHIDLTYLDTETRMQESTLQLVYLESHLHNAKVECPRTDGWENTYGSRCLKARVLTEAQQKLAQLIQDQYMNKGMSDLKHCLVLNFFKTLASECEKLDRIDALNGANRIVEQLGVIDCLK